MEKRIVLFIVGCCALLMFSCLDSNNTEYTVSRDCQIVSFSLSNDSIEGLEDVVFTIDQVGGYIFNSDSMPYGTVLNEKAICTFQRASNYVIRTQAIQQATGDTIDVNSGDSLDFSQPVTFINDSLDFSQPVTFINTWADGTTTKAYRAWVNIHQVNPDSMAWGLYQDQIPEGTIQEEKVVVFGEGDAQAYYMYTQPSGADASYHLYRSPVSDGHQWEELPVTGLPAGNIRLSQLTVFKNAFYAISEEGTLYRSTDGSAWVSADEGSTYAVRALLGCIRPISEERQTEALTAVVEAEGSLVYAKMTDETTGWELGAPVASGFPMSGFGNASFTSRFLARVLVVAGRDSENRLTNATWSTEDGLTWSKLTGSDTTFFDAQEGMALIPYDNEDPNTENSFFLLSGIDASGTASSEIYFSRDGGINWSPSDSLIMMPQEFKARGFASIHVDADNFIYLFGGKETPNSNVLNEIWRGRINRLGF